MTTGPSVSAGQRPGDGAQQTAGRVAGQAQEKAQEMAVQAQEKAQEAAAQAQGKLREQLDQRSSELAGRITQQAQDLRTVSESLREQGKEQPAGVADRLAGYIEKVGGYLQGRDADALLADAEDFSRRRPWVVGGAATAAGFAAARFLRASSRDRYSARQGFPSAAGSRQRGRQYPAPEGPAPGGPIPERPRAESPTRQSTPTEEPLYAGPPRVEV